MFGRKVLNEILSIVKGESRVVGVLEKRIEALEGREGRLLDRLMAKNYAEYILGRDVVNEEGVEVKEIPEDSQEDNAGGILEVKE